MERDNPPKPPFTKQEQSPKTITAKQKSSPKQPKIVQQSLIDYLENIVKFDIEFTKKHSENKRLTR
jgi:hypothetical protein